MTAEMSIDFEDDKPLHIGGKVDAQAAVIHSYDNTLNIFKYQTAVLGRDDDLDTAGTADGNMGPGFDKHPDDADILEFSLDNGLAIIEQHLRPGRKKGPRTLSSFQQFFHSLAPPHGFRYYSQT